jgi:hypothetical protein
VFEQFSERSRRVIFLARMNAGRRGAAAIEPVHLLDAIVREDRGEMATILAVIDTISCPIYSFRHHVRLEEEYASNRFNGTWFRSAVIRSSVVLADECNRREGTRK